jgi:hypothetical protein
MEIGEFGAGERRKQSNSRFADLIESDRSHARTLVRSECRDRRFAIHTNALKFLHRKLQDSNLHGDRIAATSRALATALKLCGKVIEADRFEFAAIVSGNTPLDFGRPFGIDLPITRWIKRIKKLIGEHGSLISREHHGLLEDFIPCGQVGILSCAIDETAIGEPHSVPAALLAAGAIIKSPWRSGAA